MKGFVKDLKGFVKELKGFVKDLKGFVKDLKGFEKELPLPALILEDRRFPRADPRLLEVFAAVVGRPAFVVLRVWLHLRGRRVLKILYIKTPDLPPSGGLYW